MAVLMLFSTVGFSMDIHYCGGEIDNVAFYSKADECKMMKKGTENKLPSCHQTKEKTCHTNSNGQSFSKKSCCDNQTITLQSLTDSEISNSFEIANVDLTFVTVFILSNFNLFDVDNNQSIEFFDYSPPLLKQDVTVLHQVFLI